MTATDATPTRFHPDVQDLREVRAAHALIEARRAIRAARTNLETAAGLLQRGSLDMTDPDAGDEARLHAQDAWAHLGHVLHPLDLAVADAALHADTVAATTLAERGL